MTVTIQITDPAVIASSVNLLQLNGSGTQPTILGMMQNVGSGMFTLQHIFNSSTTAQIQVEVSAAFQGSLQRVLSPVVMISVGSVLINQAYQITYPFGWTFTTDLDANATHFFPPRKQVNPALEYRGDVIVSSLPNPNALSLSDFYQTQAPINFYGNSASSSPLTINGMEAVKFYGIYGMIPTDVIAINKGASVIELDDVGQLHEADGLFDAMAASIH